VTTDLVAVGTSWGGLAALSTILGGLPADLDAALVIAQHRAPESHATAFRDLLGKATPLEVREANDKERLQHGYAYVAPPDYHLLVEADETLALSTDAAVAYSRPSIDVLLETAAEAYRERCAGVVLTGANDDGALGLARVREFGGATIVQDPETAERPEMPAAALAAVPDARVVRLEELATVLLELCGTTKVPA
jgi:two-component system chemotaxis response regulator CheB